jgi:dipeptidyl aminopeptidase/acylaminoacyl peptidase
MSENDDIPTTPRPSLSQEEHQQSDDAKNGAGTHSQEQATTPETAPESPIHNTETPSPTSENDEQNPTEGPSQPEADDLPLEEPTPESETPQPTPEEEHIPAKEDTLEEPEQTPDEQQEAAATIHVPIAQSAPTPAPSAPSRPFVSVEDLLELRIASDPQISPDGLLIAFTVQQCHAQTNSTSSAIWLARTGGGRNTAPWQISSGEAHDIQPRWSPDGTTLAFLSDRSGSQQIYLLSMRGGEARQVSQLAQDIRAYSWHPGGSTLLAQSAWKAIDDQQKTEAAVESHIYTHLDAAHDGEGHRQGRHQQLWLIALNGHATHLTNEASNLVHACWSPDGTEIAFCANRRKDPDLNSGQALWILTLRTGQMRRLTTEEDFAYCPAWSPDGQSIAYLATNDLSESGNYSPWLVQAHENEPPRPASQDATQLNCQSWIIDELHDEWLQPPRWYPDSRALLVPVQERGQIHLYKLDIIQQSSTRLTSNNGRYLAAQLSRDGRSIATIRADWFTPGDLWSMDGQGQNPRKLSSINDTFLQSHQLTRPRRITWSSFDGQEIDGWLYLPELPSGKRAPLIIAPHGGPALAWGDSYVHEFQVLAGRGFAVLAPNLRGSAGYGEAFSLKIHNDWGGTDFRDLLLGIEYAGKTEPIDEGRLGIGGMSYGGYLACWAISQTTRFKAAVSRNGISSLVSASLLSDSSSQLFQAMPDAALRQERSPLTFSEQIRTPLLLLHAEDDLECPFSESQQLFITLRRRKQLVVLVSYPQSSHLMDWPQVGLPEQRLDRLRRTVDWFERLV